MKILIVEDDLVIRNALEKGLKHEGMSVFTAEDGEIGYDYASSESYDAIILDIMMPKMDGIALVNKLRAAKIYTPILFLSAKSSVEDKIVGLNSGGDDYLAKPFSFDELLARLHSPARRKNTTYSDSVLVYKDLELNIINHSCKRGEIMINLSPKEEILLRFLMINKGKVLSKDEIIDKVWESDTDILPNTVEAFIKSLRTKLKTRVSSDELIYTKRGFGYVFE